MPRMTSAMVRAIHSCLDRLTWVWVSARLRRVATKYEDSPGHPYCPWRFDYTEFMGMMEWAEDVMRHRGQEDDCE